jgi:hypothetical protein
MEAIDSSYKDSEQKIVAEQHLSDRIEWIRDKPMLAAGPGCKTDANNSVPCNIIIKEAREKKTAEATFTTVATPTDPVGSAKDVCEPIAGAAAPSPSTDSLKALSPTELIRRLDDYIAALAALTNAKDRADFDNAAAKVSATVGGLAQSAPPPYSAAAPVAKASSNAALWLVGQDLDHRRLEELQSATQTACEPIHVLAEALGVVLTGQRKIRVRGLRHLLGLKIEMVNLAGRKQHVTDQTYGAAIDDAQAAADAFQTVRATDPLATAQALSDAHDALMVAVRNNDGQFAALVARLQIFAQRANDLTAAAAVTASSTNPPVKKS